MATIRRGLGGAGRGRLRRYLPLLALLVVAALLGPSAPAPLSAHGAVSAVIPGSLVPLASPSSWSTFHGGENHSGFSPEDGPNVGTLSWLFAPPTAQGNPIQTGVVANDSALFFADNFGNVWAYNLTYPPSLAWSQALGTTLTTGDVWGSELLIGGSDGALDALATSNGTIEWYRTLDGGIRQGLAVADGTVYAGTASGTVWAVNASTGALVWHTPIGAPVAGAVAVEGGTIVATTTVGGVVALSLAGSVLWNESVGAPIASGAAVFGGTVVVGDDRANVSAFDLSNGTLAWRFDARTLAIGDVIHSTPAVDPARVYVETYLGQVIALSRANGSLEWNRSTQFTGYDVLSSPAIAPNGLYVSDAYQYVDDFDPSTGQEIWSYSLLYSPAYGPPAIVDGLVIEGANSGTVYGLGPVGGPPRYEVSGTVTDPSGGPIASAKVTIGTLAATTGANGSFSLSLENGTYPVLVTALGRTPLNATVVVAGPVLGLSYVLSPVPLAPVSGRVLDGQTLLPLGGVRVFFFGPYGSLNSTVSAPDGTFSLEAPVGYDYVTASPPTGYQSYAAHLVVPPNGLTGAVIALPVVGSTIGGNAVLAPLVAVFLALVVAAAWSAQQRRARLGQPTTLFSPFATYVGTRVILLFFQAVGILSVLFVFGTMLPAASFHVGPCAFIDQGCAPGGWSNPSNMFLAFGYGMWHFLGRLFTGNWGLTSFSHLREPATTFLAWFLPNSIELALFALPIAAGIAYTVGLWAGAHPESTFDGVARLASIAGLLVPSFLIVLLFLGSAYQPFLHALGDSPYGILPTPSWFALHGGIPPWIGDGDHTDPTGFPLIDSAWHGDWIVFRLALLKTLWQSLAIALVYVSIYLRFVRHAVTEAFREPNVVAARARGVPESTILWRHTSRRVLPMLVLVFGLTLPLYIGTQALVEAMAQDNGIGTLLISQMTRTVASGFGFRAVSPGQTPESFYQVMIFLLVLVVLLGELVADVAARYLDPRLLRSAR